MPSAYGIVGPSRPNIDGDIMPSLFSYSHYDSDSRPYMSSYGSYGGRFNDGGGQGKYDWPGSGGDGGSCSPGGYRQCSNSGGGGGSGYPNSEGWYPGSTSGSRSNYGGMRGGGFRGIVDPVNGTLNGQSFVPGYSRSRGLSRPGRRTGGGSGHGSRYLTLGGSRYRSTFGYGNGYGCGRPGISRPSQYPFLTPWNDADWDDDFRPSYGGYDSRTSSLFPRRSRRSEDWALIRSPYTSSYLDRGPRRLPPLYPGAGASKARPLGARSTLWDDDDDDDEWLDVDDDSGLEDSLTYLRLEDEVSGFLLV